MYQYAVTFTRHLLQSDQTNAYVLFYDNDEILNEQFNLARTTAVKVTGPLRLGVTLFGRNLWSPKGRRAQRIFKLAMRTVPLPSWFVRGDYSIFRKHNTDFLIQPSHVSLEAVLSGLRYLVAIHDAPYQWTEEHRKTRTPAFLEWYEALITSLAQAASMILVDSASGEEAMLKGYGVPKDRIRILPFRPPDYITGAIDVQPTESLRHRFNLPEPFLFFPSKFHRHKNHLGLLDALKALRAEHGIAPPVVLVGTESNDDTFARVMTRIQEYGMTEQVRYLGYVPDQDMAALYQIALALVFPTLMGPTAIPILEAFAVGCPVICSNVEGFPEQVGDAALLINPTSAADLASAIHALCTSDRLRTELSERGKARFRDLTGGDYGREIYSIVQAAIANMEPNA